MNVHDYLICEIKKITWSLHAAFVKKKRLKTPPATPLFPSLEMEPGPQLVVQKEIPISQAITRVSYLNFYVYSGETIYQQIINFFKIDSDG